MQYDRLAHWLKIGFRLLACDAVNVSELVLTRYYGWLSSVRKYPPVHRFS
jgi:hypothetical protein